MLKIKLQKLCLIKKVNSVRVQTYLAAVSDKFTDDAIPKLKPVLLKLPDDAIYAFEGFHLKNPQTSLVLSLLVGGLGIDRFYIGDIGIGFVKLLLPFISLFMLQVSPSISLITIIVWVSICLVDYFRIMQRTRQINYHLFLKKIAMLDTDRYKTI